MRKRILSLLLAIMMVSALTMAVFTGEAWAIVFGQIGGQSKLEELTPPSFYVNGQPVYSTEVVMMNGVTYVSLRDFFEIALPDCVVGWKNGQATVTGTTPLGERLTVTATPGMYYLNANGRYLFLENQVQSINGVTMVPIAVLAQIFNGSAYWDDLGNCHAVLSDTLLMEGSAYYRANGLDLLARLIHSEAGNQPMKGKIAVGNVVLNRVDSNSFPGTMYDVIYQKNQFSVVRNGAINKIPNESSILAAKLVLEGITVTDALFFHRAGISCWASRNRPYIATIGDHDFYA